MDDLGRALDRISAIHAHLARTEVAHDVRALPVVLSGLLAFAAAGFQDRWLGLEARSGPEFAGYWIAVAGLAAAIGASGLLERYLRSGSASRRRQTRFVVGQFLPSLVAGAMITWLALGPAVLPIGTLPGLWSMLMGLGVLAARPCLPKAIGWVGLFYLSAGVLLLGLVPAGVALSPWAMGLTFGLGQVFGGVVLYRNKERATDD